MTKLKPTTLKYIQKLLRETREYKKDSMLQSIESNYPEDHIKTRVTEYQEINEVYGEFDDWVDELLDSNEY